MTIFIPTGGLAAFPVRFPDGRTRTHAETVRIMKDIRLTQTAVLSRWTWEMVMVLPCHQAALLGNWAVEMSWRFDPFRDFPFWTGTLLLHVAGTLEHAGGVVAEVVRRESAFGVLICG